MKKLLSALSLSVVLSFFAMVTSAHSFVSSIGVAASYGAYSVTGQETEGTETHNATEEATVAFGEIFVEMELGPVLFGLSYIPVDVDTETSERTDTVSLSTHDETNGTTSDAGTSSVQVDLQNHTTLYAVIPVGTTGFYIRPGFTYVEIITNESLHTGSTYGNTDIDGYVVNVGYQLDQSNSFVRAEIGYSEYDTIDITASNADNKVTGDLDGYDATLMIGKYF